ncbi:MAG TPA: mercuric reductase [Planctomycetaceae bacterium]|nr:mercuric reductase [Planctomycetaceae bacterium]
MTQPIRIAPDDEFNRQLVARVHPADWKNPTPVGRYNLVVIGAGTAGLVSAIGAAGLGAKVALVERELMGGDCLNVGCVPSKALIAAARVASTIRRAGDFGIDVPPGVRVDFAAVMQRMRRLRSSISPNDSAERCRSKGVDVFLGEARFTSPDKIAVGDAVLSFSKAVIASGARAVRPDIPGLADAGFLTNETVFSLTELPLRLAVIGAGPIGCELAQAFARFGARVTLLGRGSRVLPREDGDAAERIEQVLARDGVALGLGSRILEVGRRGAEKVLRLESGAGSTELVIDEILVGAGRAPNVEGLDLESAGVAYDTRHGIVVDDRLRTTNPHVYAAGDVCSPFKFTHAADAMARVVIQNALFLGRARASRLTIPWCTYTDPEIAHVGLSKRDAQEREIAIDTFVEELRHVDRAIIDGATEGFVKIHVLKGTDRIAGATILAPHAGEMISEITLAMTAGLGLKTLAKLIHPYPTQTDAVKRAADAYSRTRLTPRVRRLFEKWLAWRR